MTEYTILDENAVDYDVENKEYKTSASWVENGMILDCEFFRSVVDGYTSDGKAKWKEVSRDKVFSVNLETLPRKVIEFCIRYGFKQIAADRNFAMAAETFTVDLERDKLASLAEFMVDMDAAQDIPTKRKKGLSKAQKKEQARLFAELSKCMGRKDFAAAGKVMDEIEAKGLTIKED